MLLNTMDSYKWKSEAFVNMLDIKHHIKGKAVEQTEQTSSCEHFCNKFYGFVFTTFKLTKKCKKMQKMCNIHYSSCLHVLLRYKTEFQCSDFKGRGSSSYFTSVAAATATAPCSNHGIHNINLLQMIPTGSWNYHGSRIASKVLFHGAQRLVLSVSFNE